MSKNKNIVCKIFGHKYFYYYCWCDRLKVNILMRTCIRCLYEDWKYYSDNKKEYEEDACNNCGAWVCTSGICSYCE